MASVGESVRKALEDYHQGELEFPMLHACNALDGTAAKLFPDSPVGERFKRAIRDNYSIFGPMAAPNVDLINTKFLVATRNRSLKYVDMAEMVYLVHRCSHGHGDVLPDGFELLPDSRRGGGTTLHCDLQEGKVKLSDRTIFGLLAVAIFSPANTDQRLATDQSITFAGRPLVINEWWGRADDFAPLVAAENLISVKLDFANR